MTLELGRVAAAFTARKAWTVYGYMAPNDFSRELLDRSGRWLRELSLLGEALQRLPGLGAALDGSDGSPPLGRVAAVHVAQVATPASLDAWLAVARRCSVRELRAHVRRAVESGTNQPADFLESAEPISGSEPAAGSESTAGEAPQPAVIELRAADLLVQDEADTEVRVALPRPVAAAFEEGLELHRLVTGRSSGTTSFVEALVGEAAAAGLVGGDESALPPGITTTSVDAWHFALPELERARTPGRHSRAALAAAFGIRATETECPAAAGSLGAADLVRALWQRNIEQLDPAALEWAQDLLDRVERKTPGVVRGGARRLGWRLGGLLSLESELERCIAHLLSFYPWSAGPGRGKGSLGAAAEEILGVSRRTVERRVGLRRALAWLPRLRAAYESGDLGMEAAWQVWRVLGKGPVEVELERDWLGHAIWLTVKRLQGEVQLVERRRHGLVDFDGDDYRRPPTDEEWFASLRTVPGSTRARIAALAARTRRSPNDNVFLTLRLPEAQAQDFVAAIGAACREKAPERLSEWPAGVSSRAWAGLLVLLEDFAATWDDPRGMPKRAGERTHRRHGYRCLAPGCTARAHLQVHHIQFRSQGGSDNESNRILLCWRHHQEGVHGGLARCTGRAPLDVLWQLGRPNLATWYRNERRLRA